jgi:hypothetical protein
MSGRQSLFLLGNAVCHRSIAVTPRGKMCENEEINLIQGHFTFY